MRSRAVPLVLIPTFALAFTGCGEENAYCVDANDVVVENIQCDDDTSSSSHFWYFGGGTYSKNSRVSGGERVQASNKAALAQRGGFGSAKSSGSGVGKSFGGGFSVGG